MFIKNPLRINTWAEMTWVWQNDYHGPDPTLTMQMPLPMRTNSRHQHQPPGMNALCSVPVHWAQTETETPLGGTIGPFPNASCPSQQGILFSSSATWTERLKCTMLVPHLILCEFLWDSVLLWLLLFKLLPPLDTSSLQRRRQAMMWE